MVTNSTLLPVLESNASAKRTDAVCPYCGVGCVLTATVENNRVTRIKANPESAPNYGMMCPKGALLSRVFDDPERIEYPMIRRNRNEPLKRVSWDEAIQFVASQLKASWDKSGGDRIAWYGSGQLDTEASYIFTKLFKGYLRSNHTDTNSRLCMSSAVAGYSRAFGSDAPPTCYDDIESADTFIILGANMAVNHPVLFNRIRRRRTDNDRVRVITIDPRHTKTAQLSDLHLPVAPGGDVALLKWLMRYLLDKGELSEDYIADYTEGWEEVKQDLLNHDQENLEQIAGLTKAQLTQFAEYISCQSKLLTFYCMGANQSSRGTDKNTSIINLHLMLGQVGQPGSGPFSLTGQPNAMGGREVGYLGHQLPGYRFVADTNHRDELEQFWGIESGTIQAQPGLTAVPMFEAASQGEFDVMWIACTNPVVSMPNANIVKQALKKTPLVIVQDITKRSETSDYADVLLPACQWGEKSGTMTNSERLVVRSHAFLDPPSQAKPDWWIPTNIGKAMGFNGFDFNSNEEVWDEYRQITRGRPCDQYGMTNERLSRSPLHWPCTDSEHPGTLRRYESNHFHSPSGRAKFNVGQTDGPVEKPDSQFPIWLTTGRVASHWHTRTKSGLSKELNRQEPEPFIEIHPDDADQIGLADHDWCVLTGRRGRARARVRLTQSIRQGLAFSTFHFGDRFSLDSNINVLTQPRFDAISQQPELKACAIRVEPDSQNTGESGFVG